MFSRVMGEYGLSGLYYAIAITQALMLLPILLMQQKASVEYHPHHHLTPDSKLLSTVGICMMATMFLFSTRDTMGWAFVEQVGVRVGYSA